MAVDIGGAEFEAEGGVEAVGRLAPWTRCQLDEVQSELLGGLQQSDESTPTWLPRAASSTATSSTSPNCPVRVVQMQQGDADDAAVEVSDNDQSRG